MLILENVTFVDSKSKKVDPATYDGEFRAIGVVYNHPSLSDGSVIKTSPIKSITSDAIVTANSVYKIQGPA